MKRLVFSITAFFALNSFAGSAQHVVATCVRADSGDSPEITVISNPVTGQGLILLSADTGKDTFVENTTISKGDASDEYTGTDISIEIPTQLETETETYYTDLTIHGDTDNIEPWLKAHTNISDAAIGHEDPFITFICNQPGADQE